jgi:DNA-binding Xre family transcriptional regulator/biotin operon repressor
VIEIRIAEKAKVAGLDTAFSLQKALNISPTIASRLWKGKFNKIGVGTMDKLCTFFKCQLSDLFFFTGETVTQSSNKSLTQLSKVNRVAVGDDNVAGMLSLLQVAERLGLSRKRVNDYVNQGKLKATKNRRGHNFVSEPDLQAFIDS